MKIEINKLKKKSIQCPEDTHEIIKSIFYRKKKEMDFTKKHLWTIALNQKGKILNIELVSVGSKNQNIADPSDVFRIPLYKTSSYIVIVHNYVSDDTPSPTIDDIDVTDRLIQGGEILNLEVIDHVIVTEKTFYSFEKEGDMDSLRDSDRYATAHVYKKRMKRELENLKIKAAKGVQQLVNEQKIEWKKQGEKVGIELGIGKSIRDFHEGGISLEKIATITGRSVDEIKRIIKS